MRGGYEAYLDWPISSLEVQKMNRCSKCMNDLAADARYCNICGTPQNPSSNSPLPEPTRTIQPVVRRIPIPAAQKSLPPVGIPKTTIEYTSVKSSPNTTASVSTSPDIAESPSSGVKPGAHDNAQGEADALEAKQPATAPLRPASKPVGPVPVQPPDKPAATAPLQPSGRPATPCTGNHPPNRDISVCTAKCTRGSNSDRQITFPADFSGRQTVRPAAIANQ